VLFVAALPQNISALATSEAQTLGPIGRVGKSKLLAMCALPVILRSPTHYRSIIVRVTNYNRLVDVSEKNVHNPTLETRVFSALT